MVNDKKKQQNIILIGMSGAGKTTIGMALSYRFKMPFVDMDNYISRMENKTISQIFEDVGNDGFREIEAKVAKRIGTHFYHTIVSTGGGVVLRDENMQYLKEHGLVVYINRSVENILKTLNADRRPLLKDSPHRLYDMYDQRHELYLKYADIVVANSGDFKSGVQNVYDAIKNCI